MENHTQTPPVIPPPRVSGRALAAIAGLSILAVTLLFYTIEGWRGRRAWRLYEAGMKAQGVELNFDAFIPPPVPDERNFAMTPFLKPLYDFVPGTQVYKLPNAPTLVVDGLGAAKELARDMGFELGGGKPATWVKGEATDLIRVLATDEEPTPPGSRAKRSATPAKKPASQEEAAALIREIQSQTVDPILEELRAASRKPYSRFNIKYDTVPLSSVLLPHLPAIKIVTQQLVWRTAAQLALGKTNEAFEDLNLGLYVGDSLKGEPVFVSFLVRLACRELLTQAIYDGLAAHQWSEAQLERLIAGLGKDDFLLDTRRALLGERASFGVRSIEQVRRGEGGMRLDDLLNQGDENSLRIPRFKPIHYVFPSGWLYLEQLSVCRAYDRTLEPLAQWLATRGDPQEVIRQSAHAYDAWEKDRSPLAVLRRHETLARMLVPATGKIIGKGFRAQTVMELTRVACALERYYLAQGNYPDKLEALAPQWLPKLPNDPMSGQAFHYQKESAKKYVLYSVGANFMDNGGTVGLGKNGVVNVDEGDWVWRL